MKKIITALSLMSSMVLGGDYYGGLDIDVGDGSTEETVLGTTNTYDFTQTSFGIHGGYFLDSNSRAEVYFKDLTFDFDQNSNIDATQFGVDYIYTLNEVSKFTPYVGAGLSLSSLDLKLQNKDSMDGVGLRLRGGAYYALTPKLDIGVELNYNYIAWEDLKSLQGNIDLESSSSFYGLGLNLNYKF